MKTPLDPTKCPIQVGELYYKSPCGRPVPEGESKCRLHLSHDRRNAERNAKWKAEYAIEKAKADENDGLATALFGLLDGEVTVGFSRTHVLLTPQAANLIITKLLAQKGA